MKGKIISFILLVFLFSSLMYLYTNAWADDIGNLKITAEYENNKEFIVANVSISNNPGIATFTLHLYFDENKLEPISITKGDALPIGEIISNLQADNIEASLPFISAFWVNATNISTNGILYTVRFKVKPGAIGTTNLSLIYKQGDICNQQFDDVEFNVIDAEFQLTELTPYIEITDNTLGFKDNFISGDININLNNNGRDRKITLLLAVYDNKDKLIYIKTKANEPIKIGNTSVKLSDIKITNVASPIYSLKIMCWDSLTTMKPLTKYVYLKP